MIKIPIKLNLEDIVRLLECLSFDDFEVNKDLIQKIINQLEIPLNAPENFWDRVLYFANKLTN